MTKDALKVFIKTGYILTDNCNRRPNNSGDANGRTDENLIDKTAKFATLINAENTHRFLLRFLCAIVLVNYLVKLDTKIICTL